jgi:WD40 repeat protein
VSEAATASLLSARGVTHELGAHVIAACFDRAGRGVAFGLGDGSVVLLAAGASEPRRVDAHDGAVMALCPDARADGFISAGDDGTLLRISPTGEITKLYASGGKWIEHVACFAEPRGGLIACASGRHVHLFDVAGQRLKTLTHPSTVTGIAFDTRGKRIAASHYNGASLWFTASKSNNPRLLEWKGSHTGVAIHPAIDAVVTSMQENSLHGWRLSDGQHMRMSGYPAKTESLGFTRSGKWLASSGADSIVLWPFFGGGPMGKLPTELAQIENVLCTRIACHPKDELVAAGYANGIVLIAQISSRNVLPLNDVGPSPISALAWSPDGAGLAFGTEWGQAAFIDLSASRSPIRAASS